MNCRKGAQFNIKDTNLGNAGRVAMVALFHILAKLFRALKVGAMNEGDKITFELNGNETERRRIIKE
jgi:hypothetical protein